MNPDLTSQVLAALDKLDGKIDSIRESLSEHRSGITALEMWRVSAQAESVRAWGVATDLEQRTRKLEEFTAAQKVRIAVAACVASAIVSGAVGLLFRLGH